MANWMGTNHNLLWTGLCLLMTGWVAKAGETCTYTEIEDEPTHYRRTERTAYCHGHCCDDHAQRCCEDHISLGFIIGVVLASSVFVAVVITMIVVMCKRSNLKRARVAGGQTLAGNSGTTELVVIRHHDTGLPRVFYTNPPPYAFKYDTQGPPPPVFSGSRHNGAVGGEQWGAVDRTLGRAVGGARDDMTGGTQSGAVNGTQGRTVGGEQSGAVGASQGGAVGGTQDGTEGSAEGMTQSGTQRGFTNISAQADSNSEVRSYPWDSPSYNWDVRGSVDPARHNCFVNDFATGSNGEAGPRPWDTPNYNWSMGGDTDQPSHVSLPTDPDSSGYPWDGQNYNWDISKGKPDDPPPPYTFKGPASDEKGFSVITPNLDSDKSLYR